MNAVVEPRPGRWLHRARLASGWERIRYPLAIYVASRLLYLVIAVVESLVWHHTSISRELSNWDGQWYIRTAEHWYPHFVLTHRGQYTTLGFLPLFPMLEWLLAHTLQIPIVAAGIALSVVFGAVATILLTELAGQWWGRAAARRTLLFWCFFPGTVVFSMVYTESLTITLVAACLMLLGRKRWGWAGLTIAAATAIAPAAVAGVPMCAVAAWRELRDRGWRDHAARRSLLAPILSPLGLVAFGIFLWFWCGTPLASYKAQHGAWEESSTPLAIPRTFGSMIHQIFISGVGQSHGPGGIDLNGILALLGTIFMIYAFWRLWKARRTLPLTAWTWTVFVALLALTSAKTPPNPRLLILMFPLVLVVGAERQGRAQKWLLVADIAWLLVLTPLTLVGGWLRP